MEGTRWLDNEEMRLWRAFLDASVLVIGRINDALKEASSLTLDDYEVLVQLSNTTGQRMRMSDLSRELRHSQSRATQRVDRLVERDLVIREKSETDARVTYACLTEHGRQAMEQAAPEHLVDVREWLVDLIEPQEQAPFADVLERIAKIARADRY